MNNNVEKYVLLSVIVSKIFLACVIRDFGFHKKIYKEVLETKPIACREPDLNTCKCRYFTLKRPCIIQKWVFNPFFKTCDPLCFEDQRIPAELQDLPSTRRECENLCGEPCVVTYPNGTTLSEPGVCMGNSFCDIDPEYPLWQWLLKIKVHPCETRSTSCCPRDYLCSSEIPYMLRP